MPTQRVRHIFVPIDSLARPWRHSAVFAVFLFHSFPYTSGKKCSSQHLTSCFAVNSAGKFGLTESTFMSLRCLRRIEILHVAATLRIFFVTNNGCLGSMHMQVWSGFSI